MARRLLHLAPERIEAELACVRAADAVLVWFAGVVILGGAFRTTSMEWGSVLLLLGPLIATFGPIAVAYAFWVTSGEL